MAGRGPAPKHAGARARRNKTPEMRVVAGQLASQPALPSRVVRGPDGKLVGWPKQTRDWWRWWGQSPLSDDFGATDWSFLLDTALLHAQYWLGDLGVAGELRLREAKLGATPEDRLRLRIQFETADEAAAKGEQRRAAKKPAAKAGDRPDPRRGLHSAG